MSGLHVWLCVCEIHVEMVQSHICPDILLFVYSIKLLVQKILFYTCMRAGLIFGNLMMFSVFIAVVAYVYWIINMIGSFFSQWPHLQKCPETHPDVRTHTTMAQLHRMQIRSRRTCLAPLHLILLHPQRCHRPLLPAGRMSMLLLCTVLMFITSRFILLPPVPLCNNFHVLKGRWSKLDRIEFFNITHWNEEIGKFRNCLLLLLNSGCFVLPYPVNNHKRLIYKWCNTLKHNGYCIVTCWVLVKQQITSCHLGS